MEVMRRIQVDVALPGSQCALYVRQGETRVYTLVVSLCERSLPLALPESWSAVLRGKKPDGTMLFLPAGIDSGVVRAYFSAQAFTAVGVVQCQLDILGQDGKALYSPRFDVFVEPMTVQDGEIESTDDFKALADALGEVAGAVADCQEATQECGSATAAIDGMTVSVEQLPPGQPSVDITLAAGVKNIHFGIPEGRPGMIAELSGDEFAFHVDDRGHLMMHYANESNPPGFEVDARGHLVLRIS